MKAILVLGFSMFISIGAGALPIDRLKCRISIAPAEDNVLIADHKFDVSLIRYPDESFLGHPVTKGKFLIDNSLRYKGYSIGYSVELTNSFAVRETQDKSEKKRFEAVQNFCFSPEIYVCKLVSGGDIPSCPVYKNSCLYSIDPFDPVYGWEVARVDSSGTPIFNQKTMKFPQFEDLVGEGGEKLGTLVTYCTYEGLVR